MEKKYLVRLTAEECALARSVVQRLSGGSQKVRRAQILLQADTEQGPGWTDQEIAAAYRCRSQTVANVRRRLVEKGFTRCPEGDQRSRAPRVRLLDGRQEAQVIDTRLGAPPGGLRELEFALTVPQGRRTRHYRGGQSRDTAADAKKNAINTRRKTEYWVIPPESDSKFVDCMEEVLDTYERPYDPAHPVVCMDEQPVQLIKETREPIAATAQRSQRVDYEYERAGTACIFMFSEPLGGWRSATARPQRKKTDWAAEMAALLDGRYAACAQLTLVYDNLNTHTKGAFYEAFEAEQARQYVRRIELCYTPKHGSWLNIAECELSAMTRQCTKGRRIGKIKKLRKQLRKWAGNINAKQRGVDWQMKVNDARMKLKTVYPKTLT